LVYCGAKGETAIEQSKEAMNPGLKTIKMGETGVE